MVYTFMTDTWNLSDAGWAEFLLYEECGHHPLSLSPLAVGKRLSLSPRPPPLLQSGLQAS